MREERREKKTGMKKNKEETDKNVKRRGFRREEK